MTKNDDIDKYGYSGYGTGFDRKSSSSFPSGRFGQNVIIFGVDMSSSAHVDNKKKTSILGKGPTQGLEHTVTAKKMYWISFTVTKKKFSLILHYNGANSYLFVNGTEIYKFKARDPEIAAVSLCLGNISKGWSEDNMKKTGFSGYAYDFSVDYDATDVDDIFDIHKYLMKRKWQSVIKCLDLLKKVFFVGLTVLSSFTSPNSLNCISINNQECNARPQVFNVNGDEPVFSPFSIKTSKCSDSCNNIKHS